MGVSKIKEVKGFLSYNFSELTGRGRFYIIIGLVFAGFYFLMSNTGASALLLDSKIGIFELFPFLTANTLPTFLIVIGWFLLICDMPYQREGYKYYMFRSKRSTWLFAQVMYLFLVAMRYLFSVFIAVNVVALPNITISNDWSLLMRKALYDNTYLGNSAIYLKSNILDSFSPMEASLRAFVLMTFMLTVIGIIILLCNLYTSRLVGYLIVALLLSIDVMADTILWNQSVIDFIHRICPVSLGRNLQLESSFNTGEPGFLYCILVMFVWLIICYSIMWKFIKKVDFK